MLDIQPLTLLVTRRQFIARSAIAAVGSGVVAAGYARFVEPFWVEFVDHALPVRGLPSALDGKLLMQVSDLHVGHVDQTFLLESLARAAALQPDLVVFTGDFITYNTLLRWEVLDEVLQAAPRGRLGSAAIFGNHDYGPNWDSLRVAARVEERLRNTGIEVLRNSAVSLAGLQMVGFEDLWSPRFGGPNLLRDVTNHNATVVLCHNPDACDLPIWGDFDGWILAGHTHGGQVRLPLIGAPIVPVKNKRYVAGDYEVGGGRRLYINRALGNLYQVRFGARPEITLHRLRAT